RRAWRPRPPPRRWSTRPRPRPSRSSSSWTGRSSSWPTSARPVRRWSPAGSGIRRRRGEDGLYGESSRGPSPRSAHLIMLREHPDELLPRTERGDRAQRGRAVLLLDEEMMLRTPDLHHEVLAGLLVERRDRKSV